MIKESIAALSLTNDPNGKFEAFTSLDYDSDGSASLYQGFQPFRSCRDVVSLDTACAIVQCGPLHVVHLLFNDHTGTQGDRGADGSFSPPYSRCSEVWYLLSSEERAQVSASNLSSYRH